MRCVDFPRFDGSFIPLHVRLTLRGDVVRSALQEMYKDNVKRQVDRALERYRDVSTALCLDR